MNIQRRTLQILLTLAAVLALPMAAAAELCPIAVDTPAVVTVEAESGITLDAASAGDGTVVLEASPSHLVIANRYPAVLLFDGPTGCALRVDVVRSEVRERGVAGRTPVGVTSFHPLELATKQEDHEIDPDPESTTQDPARPLLTLIHVDPAIAAKQEDHEIDPDPGFTIPSKQEDHEIDPDPGFSAAAALAGRLGPGWYFVVAGGEVTGEILIDSRQR